MVLGLVFRIHGVGVPSCRAPRRLRTLDPRAVRTPPSLKAYPPVMEIGALQSNGAEAQVLDLKTTSSQKCEAVPRRARIEHSKSCITQL